MKGIAPFLIAAIIFVCGASALAISAIAPSYNNSTQIQNTTNPIDIGTNAAAHVPWQDVWDYFFGGLIGMMRWLSNYLIMPLVNFGASGALSALSGHSVHIELPWYLGYVILFLILLIIFYWKWNTIWDFVLSKTILALVIVTVVIVLIIAMYAMGGGFG